MKVTATEIVYAIGQLPQKRAFNYINPKTRSVIEIVDVKYPEGPITIKRYNPSKGGAPKGAKEASISPQMLWRVANAFSENLPINLDRVLGASYNTRSALESLLAYTPQFYVSYPGRIQNIRSSSDIKKGHKHLLWRPNQPHEVGKIACEKSEMIISEIPNAEAVYEALVLPDATKTSNLDIDVQRRHAQMQIALIMIGIQLGFRTWIAHNDKGIIYKQQKIGEMQTVVKSLDDEHMIAPFPGAINAARLIDCIWFKNAKLMPAVMEVEHSTGVTSGLTRMQALQQLIPEYKTRYVIVAPDEDRSKVIKEINRPQFRPLAARYFPYSAVEELYALCQRRQLRGVTDEFLDCYIEPALEGVSQLN
ncbi:MAG: restriction endonuclease [Candidatus Omnitrophota bacterium]|jgi:type II restriction enzyme